MREATLAIKMPGSWICMLSKQPDFSVRVLGCKAINGSSGRGLVEIIAPNVGIGALEKTLMRQSGVCNVNIARGVDGRYVGTVDNLKCRACAVLTNSGCYLTSAKSMSDGRVMWNIIAIDGENVYSLMKSLKRSGCAVELIKSIRLTQKALLTTKQQVVLALAFELGYFDVPRKISIERLAGKFKISKSTLDVILRRAERRILENYLAQAACAEGPQ